MSSNSDVITSVEWSLSESLSCGYSRALDLQSTLDIDESKESVGEWDHNGGVVFAVPRSEQEYYWSDCVVSIEDVR